MTQTTTGSPAPPPLALRAWLRYDVVSRAIDDLKPHSMLEIGCGMGAFGGRIADRLDYLAVEPDPSSFAIAQSRIEPRGGTVINGIHSAVPAGKQFDAVCAFEVLEHIEDDKAALADWVPFIKPGGHMILSVPAFPKRFGPMDTQAGHFRRYTPDELRKLLVEAGLVVDEVIVYAWPLGYALEFVRNRIDAKKIAASTSIEKRTAASGRTFQPTGRWSGRAMQIASLPFRYLQRVQTTRGTGLVAIARRP